MKIDNVIAISGKPGLYQLVTQTKNGFIAKNLIDGKKTSVAGSKNVSLLSNVAIYTLTDEMPLADIFSAIYVKENGGQAISHKSSEKEVEAYFGEVVPEYDRSRVYKSDMKKVIQWYNLLQKNDLVAPEAEANEEAQVEEETTQEA